MYLFICFKISFTPYKKRTVYGYTPATNDSLLTLCNDEYKKCQCHVSLKSNLTNDFGELATLPVHAIYTLSSLQWHVLYFRRTSS